LLKGVFRLKAEMKPQEKTPAGGLYFPAWR